VSDESQSPGSDSLARGFFSGQSELSNKA